MLNKDSGNSSKPPSSDLFRKVRNSREKTGRIQGGRAGHPGCVPTLYENPATIINHKREKCSCGGTVVYPDEYQTKQAAEPEIRAKITGHRSYTGVCGCCGATVKNEIPLNDIITYGDSVKAFAAMLSCEGPVSINRIKPMLSEVTDGAINLSEGAVANRNRDLSGKPAVFIAEIKEKLLTRPVLRKDETGIRVDGGLHRLHVPGNELYTLYFSNKKRGNEADREIDIPPAFSGVPVHGHLKGLYGFNCEHAECNAHILRYLKSAAETKNRARPAAVTEFLVNANNVVKEHKAENIPALDAAVLTKYRARYDEILKQGWFEFLQDKKKDYNGEDMKLYRRLKEYKREHLRFLSDFRVPFDNNLAERDLRMIKSKTKISGCFRGGDGGAVFANIKSYTSTLRKNSKNIFDGLKAAFGGTPFSRA
jgi:transposase